MNKWFSKVFLITILSILHTVFTYIYIHTYTYISFQIFKSIILNVKPYGSSNQPSLVWVQETEGQRDYVRGPRSMSELVWEPESRTSPDLSWEDFPLHHAVCVSACYYNFLSIQLNMFLCVFTELWKYKSSATWLALITTPDSYGSVVLNLSCAPKSIAMYNYPNTMAKYRP